MIRFTSFRLAIGLMCLMLASCAAIKEKTVVQPAGWVEQQQQRQQVKVWEIRGRLGVQTQTNGGSMDLIWKQSGQDYSIRLILSLGAGNYLIQGDDYLAEIRYPNGDKEMIDNIDSVFSSVLGVNLPVSAVKDWVRGLPASSLSVDNMQWNEQGLLDTIKQSGWTVEMTDYIGNGLLFPHTIYLSRLDDTEVDIRLVLRQWLVDN
ncbi:MAG: outer membrane lipoprotein LolB [Gammaproteobacteria bacterium]|nr:outer membrane lipoprotein LolB [Gammaproteobacteria bacterium]